MGCGYSYKTGESSEDFKETENEFQGETPRDLPGVSDGGGVKGGPQGLDVDQEEKSEEVGPFGYKNEDILKPAEISVRVRNFLVDYLITFIFVYLIFPVEFINSESLEFSQEILNYSFKFSLIRFGVLFLSEFFFGKTLGKLITRTRVVGLDGEPPGFVKLLIRNLIRVFFFSLFGPPIYAIIYWWNGYILHDEWSRTAVVYDPPVKTETKNAPLKP